jgi:hypothetical protein
MLPNFGRLVVRIFLLAIPMKVAQIIPVSASAQNG